MFTFATPSPVYPLRLTGVDNGPLKVELFVLGPARARIPGFEVVDARPTAYPDPDGHIQLSRSTSRSAVYVVHPALRALAGDAAFATRLNAILSPEQMRADAIVEWDGSIPYQQVRYSARGAGLSCVQWFGGGWLVCLVLMSAGVRFGRWSGRPGGGMVSGSLVLAAVVGAVCFFRMPVVPVRMESVFQWSIAFRRAEGVFREAGLEFKAGGPLPAVESVRAAIRKVLNEDRPPWLREMRGMREEDSPRNYIVRAVPGDVEMVYFGDAGEERVYSIRKFIERQP